MVQCEARVLSNTSGPQCEACLPLYNDKPFRVGDRHSDFSCKPCLCHGHASTCVYNASLDDFPDEWDRGGGGQCLNCGHMTEGASCEHCIRGYFRPTGRPKNAPNVCIPCDCQPEGSLPNATICDRVGVRICELRCSVTQC